MDYITIANEISKRSDDPKTKVGAVLVKNNSIIGTGFNYKLNIDFDWNDKHKYMIHAELAAIANANCSCKGADIYITLSPCNECIKLLIAHGIKTIYYKDEYHDFAFTKQLAECSGIKIIKI